MKKHLVSLLLLAATPMLFCKIQYDKINYETMYKEAASTKLNLKNRMTTLRNILQHAPDSFFTKKKMLQKYRFKLKNLLVKLGKSARKTADDNLIKQFLRLIAMTFEKDTNAYKHIGALHPKTMHRCIYRIFQRQIKDLKRAHSQQLTSAWVSDNLPVQKKKYQSKLVKLKNKRKQLSSKAKLNLLQKTTLKRTKRNIKKIKTWIDNYSKLNTKLKEMQKNATKSKSNIRKEALQFARAADPIINTILSKKFKTITSRKKLSLREKIKVKKLIK